VETALKEMPYNLMRSWSDKTKKKGYHNVSKEPRISTVFVKATTRM